MPELLPGVHLVEGVEPAPGAGLNVYLLQNKGGGYTLLDTGLPGQDPAILAYLAKIGVAPTQIRTILLTHLHLDHVGGLSRMIAATKAKTYAHWLEAAFIARNPVYDGPGMLPAEPVEVDVRLRDGESVEAGRGLVAYHTPGHTPGHLAYFEPERKLLFSGDLFMGIPELSLTVPEYTHHTKSAQVSARQMSALRPTAVMSYHGGPFLKGVPEALESLLRRF
jgi:glyoxylase-like metal-dependent hydrolase (beta-lactamase superfamily II)